MSNTANILITDTDASCNDKSFQYLLWFEPSLWWMVLTKDTLDIILDGRYFSKTKKIDESNIKNIIWNQDLKINYINSKDTIWEIIEIITDKTRKITEVILEWQIATSDSRKIDKVLDFETKVLKKWEWYFSDKRINKNTNEKQNIKKAIKIIDKTFNYITKLNNSWKLKWKTELQVRWMIINKIFEFGGSWESFPAIVAFGENSSTPHHESSETIIWDWVLLIDMWAKYNWYCSDFTRTFWVWEKNEQYNKFIEIYEIVKQAHLNAFEKAEVWMSWTEIDNLTREVIEKAWYWEFFIHWTGHWVWLDIHEIPWVWKTSENKIENDMVFTIEPWIYLPWEFWIRLEDIVVMEKGKLIKYSEVEL